MGWGAACPPDLLASLAPCCSGTARVTRRTSPAVRGSYSAGVEASAPEFRSGSAQLPSVLLLRGQHDSVLSCHWGDPRKEAVLGSSVWPERGAPAAQRSGGVLPYPAWVITRAPSPPLQHFGFLTCKGGAAPHAPPQHGCLGQPPWGPPRGTEAPFSDGESWESLLCLTGVSVAVGKGPSNATGRAPGCSPPHPRAPPASFGEQSSNIRPRTAARKCLAGCIFFKKNTYLSKGKKHH